MSAEQFFDQLLALTAVLQEDQERELGALGLTAARTHVMWIVHHSGPSMQRDIAAEMDVTPRHVTTLVDELVADDLVRRAPHPDDRRAVLVSLTEYGTSLMEKMALDHAALADALVAGLSPTEVDALRRGIAQVTERLQALIERARSEEGAA